MEIPKQAAFYRQALICGIITADQTVAWADWLIDVGGDLPSAIYDLSLAGSRGVSRMVDLLTSLAQGENALNVVPALLDVLRQRYLAGALELPAVIEVIRRIKDSVPPNVDLRWELVALEEDYSLVADGIAGDLPTIHQIVRDVLSRFSGASREYLDRAA